MSIFLTFYAAALALVYLEFREPGTPAAPRTPPWPAWMWCAILVVTYAMQLGLVWYAATAISGSEPWRGLLPIGVASHDAKHPDATAAALLALGALQSFSLLGLYRSAAQRRVLFAGAAALLLLSMAAPAFISPDPYAYVGDALLGAASYAPPHSDLPGEFALINHFFTTPMLPAPYGPLWIAIARLVANPFPSLLEKLLAFRALGAASFVAFLAGLRALRVPRRILAVAALNPGLAMQYVASAHNDLLGIAAIVIAAALLRRNAVAACGLVVVAALIKLPFAILGLPILAAVPRRGARYACAIAILSGAVAVSWFGAGAGYFQGLAVHVPEVGFVHLLNAAVSVAALVAIAVAFLGGRRLRNAVWLMPMMGSYIASWYVTYGVPYALARRRILGSLLVLMPFAALLLDAKFMRAWTYAAVVPAIVILAIAARMKSERVPT